MACRCTLRIELHSVQVLKSIVHYNNSVRVECNETEVARWFVHKRAADIARIVSCYAR
jgi:hypothetical protein